jgi:hemerythrin-like domain-containing protein
VIEMSNFNNRICQTLHDEHASNTALLERVERLIGGQGRAHPNNIDPTVRELLSALGTNMANEVRRHFDFEENELFTYLDSIGENAIGAHLTDEHSVLRPLITQLSDTAHASLERGFDESGWNKFRQLGAELCERMSAHIQKEEMALLPLLEENMDPETEVRLYQNYLGNA